MEKLDIYQAMIMTRVQTFRLFTERLKEDPDASVPMDLYCTDIGFLLNMLDRSGEELSKLRKKEGRIIV